MQKKAFNFFLHLIYYLTKKFLRCFFYTVYKGDECVGKEPCRAQRLRECVARRAELAKKRALRLVLVKPLGAKIDVAAEAGCGAV